MALIRIAVASVVIFCSCTPARFNEFRGQDLATARSTLDAGRKSAEKHCGTCHLTPLPESMSQQGANFMLAYMGLFLGVDASRTLDEAEKTQFLLRFKLLKKTGALPSTPLLTKGAWANLRSYYLALARYPFVSHEKTSALETTTVAFADQGVTMLKRLSDDRIVVGGGVSGIVQFLKDDLTADFSVTLDSPGVHLIERDGGFYILTLGSLLGDLNEQNHASLYFIDQKKRTARKVLANLTRASHFFIADTNGDGKSDFIIATFGTVTGGGIDLYESSPRGYQKKTLSTHGSIVRLAILADRPHKLEFLALAGGAREALLHFIYSKGFVQEKVLIEYPPHLGSVWLEAADLNGDGQKEILVLSGDNADAGAYNEAKHDQGLRVYEMTDGAIKQVHFESLPGALTLALYPRDNGIDILATRFYAATQSAQDLTYLVHTKDFNFKRHHFTINSRPTVALALKATDNPQFLIGSGNIPIMEKNDGKIFIRKYNGPALFTVNLKLVN